MNRTGFSRHLSRTRDPDSFWLCAGTFTLNAGLALSAITVNQVDHLMANTHGFIVQRVPIPGKTATNLVIPPLDVA